MRLNPLLFISPRRLIGNPALSPQGKSMLQWGLTKAVDCGRFTSDRPTGGEGSAVALPLFFFQLPTFSPSITSRSCQRGFGQALTTE